MIDSEVIEAVRLIPDGGRTLEEHLIVALADELRSLEEQLEAARRDADQLGEQADLQGEECQRLREQLEAVTRVAEAAKTYRDVRGDYTWVQMIQALDAWEHSNPASRLHALTTDDSQNEPPDLRTDDDFKV